MKIAVYYYSRSGSTKKIAEAIAAQVGVAAQSADSALDTEVDLLFLGGAPYVGLKLDKHLQAFIGSLTHAQVKKIAVFSTSNWKGSIRSQVEKCLTDPDIQVIDAGFSCRGAMGKINQSHPTPAECQAAAAYARQTIANFK